MKLEEKLEGLLRQKKFSELTTEEATYVREFVSAEEYGHFRLILCAEKNGRMRTVLFPSKKVKQNLMAAMHAKRKKEQPVSVFLSKVADYQLPLWQAAAMIAGLLFLVSFGKNQLLTNPSTDIQPGYAVLVDTVYETKYDTVYRDSPASFIGKNVNVSPAKTYKVFEKNAPNRNTLTRQVANENVQNALEMQQLPEAIQLLADTILPNNLRELLPPEKYLWNEKSLGRSVGLDSDLMEIIETIN